LGAITYLLKFGRVLQNFNKPRKNAIPSSFCNNIVSHETKEFFKKIFIPCSLYHNKHIDSSK
jgi:hypothetical protein